MMLEAEMDRFTIAQELESRGWDRGEALALVGRVYAEAKLSVPRGWHRSHFWRGVVLLAVGVGASLYSHWSARPGGAYWLFYGAILAGIAEIIAGLAMGGGGKPTDI